MGLGFGVYGLWVAVQQGSFQEGQIIFKIRTGVLFGGPRQRCRGSEPILYLHNTQGVRPVQFRNCSSRKIITRRVLSHRGYKSFRLSRFLHCMSGPQLILSPFHSYHCTNHPRSASCVSCFSWMQDPCWSTPILHTILNSSQALLIPIQETRDLLPWAKDGLLDFKYVHTLSRDMPACEVVVQKGYLSIFAICSCISAGTERE